MSGTLRSIGRVLSRNRSQFVAGAVDPDSSGREVARGSGVFVKGKTPLSDTRGFGRLTTKETTLHPMLFRFGSLCYERQANPDQRAG